MSQLSVREERLIARTKRRGQNMKVASKKKKKTTEKKGKSVASDPSQTDTSMQQGFVEFPVQSVKPSSKRLTVVTDDQLKKSWADKGTVEAYSPLADDSVKLFSKHNLLASAVHEAFYSHHPLVLSPDAVWLTLAQGLAHHVMENPEKLRKKFVDFEGKEDICITMPTFVKGSPNNNWSKVFPLFEKEISKRTKSNVAELVVSDFSTTTETSKICSQIALMDCVKSYFRYILRGGCGIPSVIMKGTVDDWKKIRSRAEKFKNYELEWWTDELLPVLDEFVAASEGRVDPGFWQSACNLFGGSGGYRTPITGWIQTLFPYLTCVDYEAARRRNNYNAMDYDSRYPLISAKIKRNDYLGQWRVGYKSGLNKDIREGPRREVGLGCGKGVRLENIPSGLSSVPFIYQDIPSRQSHNMVFLAGLVSITQTPETGALEPQFGWAVLEAD